MVEIIPAVMADSLEDLREKLSRVDGLVPLVQLDVMDGKFVPSQGWPYVEGGPQEFTRIISEEEGFPFWNSLDFEVDLMVENPETVLENWISAGVRRIIVHEESTTELEKIIQNITARFRSAEALESGGVELGVALGVDTGNEVILPFLNKIDFVQFMGILRIGFQGEPFDERVIEKIVDLRELKPDVIIAVDGGVNLETAPVLIEAGVNRLAVGSALFESDDIEATLKKFQALG
ncbi:MAG TPA: hypothetical protein VJI74_02760 [Candidatus Paceibacterota bacterium]